MKSLTQNNNSNMAGTNPCVRAAYISDCKAARADYELYDMIALNDGTALFYESSERLGCVRVSRMSLVDGQRWGEATIAILSGDKPESTALRLNNKFMQR